MKRNHSRIQKQSRPSLLDDHGSVVLVVLIVCFLFFVFDSCLHICPHKLSLDGPPPLVLEPIDSGMKAPYSNSCK